MRGKRRRDVERHERFSGERRLKHEYQGERDRLSLGRCITPTPKGNRAHHKILEKPELGSRQKMYPCP